MAKNKKPVRTAVTTNIRVTKEAHVLVTTLASMQGLTISEALIKLIREHMPEVEREVERREAIRQEFEQKYQSSE